MSQEDKVTSESGESESEADTGPIDPAQLLMDRIETQFKKLAEILRLHDERLGALETLQEQLAASGSAEPEALPTEASEVGTTAPQQNPASPVEPAAETAPAEPKAAKPTAQKQVEVPSPKPSQKAAKPEAEPPAKPTGSWWKQHLFPKK